jgi:hypothetical protein
MKKNPRYEKAKELHDSGKRRAGRDDQTGGTMNESTSQSTFEIYQDEEGVHFKGTLHSDGYPKLSDEDNAFLSKCGEMGSISGILLGLSRIFKRSEEQAELVH